MRATIFLAATGSQAGGPGRFNDEDVDADCGLARANVWMLRTWRGMRRRARDWVRNFLAMTAGGDAADGLTGDGAASYGDGADAELGSLGVVGSAEWAVGVPPLIVGV